MGMKHLDPDWAATYILATLIGLAVGWLLEPTVSPVIYAVTNAVGLR